MSYSLPLGFAVPGPSAPIPVARLNELCWIWVKTKNQKGHYGYGSLKRYKDGKHYLVHRFFYERLKGPIPDGMYIYHTCDTPACYNPAHLFVGTQKENMLDMSDKGRAPYQSNTACKNGHEYNNENTKLLRGSNRRLRRVCKICANNRVIKCREGSFMQRTVQSLATHPHGITLLQIVRYLAKYDPKNPLLNGMVDFKLDSKMEEV